MLLILLSISRADAQDIQPRAYFPSPSGINVLTVGYSYSWGAMLFDKTIPIENVEGKIHSMSVSYSRSTALMGKAGRFDLALPVVSGNWEGDVLGNTESTDRFGLADPVLRYTLFIVGAPALSSAQFEDFKPKTIVGLSMRMTLPFGQYKSDKIINLGSNRWIFSPQIGVWHKFGQLAMEAYAGVWFFTNNNSYLGSLTRSQRPLYTFQLHLSYAFNNGIWLAASTRQSFGGAVEVEGGDRLAPESNNRIGISLSIPLSSKHIIKLLSTIGTTTTVGNNYSTIGIAWQMIF